MADYTRKINETFNEIVSGKPAGEKPKMGTEIPKLPKPKSVIRTPEPIKDPKYGVEPTIRKNTLEEQAEYIAVLENAITAIASELGIEPQQLISEGSRRARRIAQSLGKTETKLDAVGGEKQMGAMYNLGINSDYPSISDANNKLRAGLETRATGLSDALRQANAKVRRSQANRIVAGSLRQATTGTPDPQLKRIARSIELDAPGLGGGTNRRGSLGPSSAEINTRMAKEGLLGRKATKALNEEKPLSPTELALQARLQRKSGVDLGIRTPHSEGEGLTPAGKAAEANRIELQKDTIKRLSKPSNK